jgi:phosphohistidine phosphatase SixA
MTPKQILVMRHAEKPDDPRDPDLSDRGKIRAAKLADYVPTNLGVPDSLLASALSKHSARPIETITPLSEKIGVTIDSTIADRDYPLLAEEILNDAKYEGKLVLVCWHHENIPALALALGASEANIPNPWNPDVFNLILSLRYDGGAIPVVTQIIEPF